MNAATMNSMQRTLTALGQSRQQGEHTEQPAHQTTTAMGCWPCGWLSTCMGKP